MANEIQFFWNNVYMGWGRGYTEGHTCRQDKIPSTRVKNFVKSKMCVLLVQHLLTSWWAAWQSSLFIHMLVHLNTIIGGAWTLCGLNLTYFPFVWHCSCITCDSSILKYFVSLRSLNTEENISVWILYKFALTKYRHHYLFTLASIWISMITTL